MTINQVPDFKKSSLPVIGVSNGGNVSKERDSLMHFAMEITAMAAWGQGWLGKGPALIEHSVQATAHYPGGG